MKIGTTVMHYGGAGQRIRPGLPYLVRVPEMSVIPEISMYLWQRNSLSISSNEVTAQALCIWADFLNEMGVKILEATKNNYQRFFYSLCNRVSARNADSGLSSQTVSTRTREVINFYKYARHALAYDGGIDRCEVGANYHSQTSDGRWRRPQNMTCHPLSVYEWRNLCEVLGPLPLDGGKRCRDRLVAEIGIRVGLRISEITQLRLSQFSKLGLRDSDFAHVVIQLKRKGGKILSVNVPTWLIRHIEKYALTERRSAMRGVAEHDRLFVGSADSSNAGSPISVRCIQARMYAAYVKAAITKTNGRPSHTFHDLRHTYATWTYHTRKAEGDLAPWLYIQQQLGHASAEITIKTYIHVVTIFNGLLIPAKRPVA